MARAGSRLARPVGPQGPEGAPPVGLRTKLFYGFGSVAYGVKDNGFGVFLLLYYNQVLGLSAELAGLAILAALVIDAVIDPFIGHFSDNLHSRWGRKHPLMYVAAPTAAISYFFLWAPPAGLGQDGLFWYLLGAAIVTRTFITLYEIPSSSMVADLTPDYDQRTSLLSYRHFFGWMGGLSMAFLAYTVFLRATPEYPAGQLNPAGYRSYALAGSVVMLSSILISAIGTHHRIRWFNPAPPKRPFSPARTLREMGQSFWNRPFLILLAVIVTGYTATGISRALDTYVATYVWELRSEDIRWLVLGSYISASTALYLSPKISRRFGKKRGAAVLLLIVALFGPTVLWLRLLGILPANGSEALLPILWVSSVLTVALTIMSAILSGAMLADVVEHSQLTTGRRSDGLFFSANSFAQKCVSGAGVFGTSLILAAAEFPQGARPGEVAEPVLDELLLTYILVMAGLHLATLLMLWAFPLDRERHQANLRRLADAKAAAAAG